MSPNEVRALTERLMGAMAGHGVFVCLAALEDCMAYVCMLMQDDLNPAREIAEQIGERLPFIVADKVLDQQVEAQGKGRGN
jgi:hypothetical protein